MFVMGFVKKSLVLCLAAALCFGISGCGSNTLRDQAENAEKTVDTSEVPRAFVLTSMTNIDNAGTIDVTISENADTVHFVSLADASDGTSLDFSVFDDDSYGLFDLINLTGIYGKPSTAEDLDRYSKLNPYGYSIEFTDAKGNFYEGLARITFLTNMKTGYASVIGDDGNTRIYQIKASNELMNNLNKIVAGNVSTNAHAGWFNRVFK